MKTKLIIGILKFLCGLYIFFVLPIMFGFGVGWATAITLLAILVYLYRDIVLKENGGSSVIILFGLFAKRCHFTDIRPEIIINKPNPRSHHTGSLRSTVPNESP